MVSDDTDWSSGATGMAWADIAIIPKPMANKAEATIFMVAPFRFAIHISRFAILKEPRFEIMPKS
jgi:hypothetical protein